MKNIVLAFSFALSAQAFGQSTETYRDNVGSSVTIETASWENGETDVSITFTGSKLIETLQQNCYPDGSYADETEGSYVNGGIIRYTDLGTQIGISHERGISLCYLSWNEGTLNLMLPFGVRSLWKFDGQ